MIIEKLNIHDLDNIIMIWNETLIKDKITREDFIRIHVNDVNFDDNLFLVAKEEGEIVGFLFGIERKQPYFSKGLESSKAWIKCMGVKPCKQKMGIGGKLLNEFETIVKSIGKEIIVLGMYSPNYIFPGIDKDNYEVSCNFFEKRGYIKIEESFWMDIDLRNFEYPVEILNKKKTLEDNGFVFKRFEINDTYELLNMAKNNFSDSWVSYICEAIKHGYAEKTILVCYYKDRIVGYIERASIDLCEQRIGPFGVDEQYRNQKLGGVLLNELFADMKEKNLKFAFFKSTEQNGKRFYARNNMKLKRVMNKYEKRII